jgi:hypothetical protein
MASSVGSADRATGGQEVGPGAPAGNLLPALEQQSQTPVRLPARACSPTRTTGTRRSAPRAWPSARTTCALRASASWTRGGYHTFPLACSRYDQAPGETYGRSPAMMVLPSLKTLNAEKRTFLKQGHRARRSRAPDGGRRPDRREPQARRDEQGRHVPDGKPLMGILPTGSIQITKEMMDEEKALINDMFLVSLFQIMAESPQMTATEVIERVNEKGILIAPVVGRQGDEYLGPMIDREINLASEMGLLAAHAATSSVRPAATTARTTRAPWRAPREPKRRPASCAWSRRRRGGHGDGRPEHLRQFRLRHRDPRHRLHPERAGELDGGPAAIAGQAPSREQQAQGAAANPGRARRRRADEGARGPAQAGLPPDPVHKGRSTPARTVSVRTFVSLDTESGIIRRYSESASLTHDRRAHA